MQDAAREHWRIMASDDPPREVDDFGFYYPLEYVLETGQLLVNYRIMPKAGGWDEQDYWWKEDMLTYLAGLARAKWDARPTPPGMTNGEGEKAPSWMDVISG